MGRAVSVLLFAAMAFFLPATAVLASVPGTSATAGVRFGDGASGGFIDFVLPVVATEKGVGFINPRFSLEDRRENELNIGAGWRQLAFGDRVLLGGNLYFDSRYTEHNNRFNQLGLGLEVLSQWLDARVNYYLPEDTRELIASQETEMVETSTETSKKSSAGYGDPYATGHKIAQDYTLTTLMTTTTTTTTTRKLFEQFESAMEGFDVEIGALLPLPSTFPAVRLFGGYYSFEDAFGKRVEGPKGRVEVRVGSFLTLDGEFFDDELNGSSYFTGARVDTPFDIAALFAGKNPFAGRNAASQSPAALAARMNEMVMRDPSVQTRASELAENEQARKVEVAVDMTSSRKTSTRTYVLMDGMTFVDDSNVTGVEDGTAEHPYAETQAGVDASGANAIVYVSAGDYSSVTLLSGVTLWGEGTAVQGYDGKRYGGGAYPTIGGASPAVTVASGTRVTGFHITNTDAPGIYGAIATGSVIIDNNVIEVIGSPNAVSTGGMLVTGSSIEVSTNGIYLITGDAEVTISGNAISCDGEDGNGILLANSGNTTAMIDGNTMLSGGVNNAGVTVDNYGGALALAVTGNSITSDSNGLIVLNSDAGSVTASASGNRVSAGEFGMLFDNFSGWTNKTERPTMAVAANGNTLAGCGMQFLNFAGTMTASAAGNTITGTSAGIVVLGSGEVTDATLSGNTMSVTDYGRGLEVIARESDMTTASLTGNTVNLNGHGQIGISMYASSLSVIDVTATDNVVNAGTGTAAAGFVFTGLSSAVSVMALGNSVTGDAATGMQMLNHDGTFVVNAATPGASGDLSGLNNGMDVSYNPDSAAFTFVP